MASPIPDTLKVIYNGWVYSLPNAQEGPDVLMKEVVDFVANMAEDPPGKRYHLHYSAIQSPKTIITHNVTLLEIFTTWGADLVVWMVEAIPKPPTFRRRGSSWKGRGGRGPQLH